MNMTIFNPQSITIEANMKSNPRFEVEIITPHKAKELMRLNTENFRAINRPSVRKLAEIMRRGEWELNGESIKVCDGVLIDGQHRLAAVVTSGITIQSLIVYDLSSSALNIDKGKPRSVIQWLMHQGFKNATDIAAVSKVCLQYKKGLWFREFLSPSEVLDSEVIEFAKENDSSLQAALKVGRLVKGLAPISTASSIAFLTADDPTSPIDDPVVRWFWSGVGRGDDLSEEDPPFLLRSRLLDNQLKPMGKLSRYHIRLLATVAWNKTALSEPMKKSSLRLVLSGPKKQRTPNVLLNSNGEIVNHRRLSDATN